MSESLNKLHEGALGAPVQCSKFKIQSFESSSPSFPSVDFSTAKRPEFGRIRLDPTFEMFCPFTGYAVPTGIAIYWWTPTQGAAALAGLSLQDLRPVSCRKLRNEPKLMNRRFEDSRSRIVLGTAVIDRRDSETKPCRSSSPLPNHRNPNPKLQTRYAKLGEKIPPLPSTPVLGTVRATFLETLNWS
jgi:hypothetical protein